MISAPRLAATDTGSIPAAVGIILSDDADTIDPSQSDALDHEAFQIGGGIARIDHLAVEELFDAAAVGLRDLRGRDIGGRRRLAPAVSAVDLGDNRGLDRKQLE